MFSTFTGNSRRPRNVNLSGQTGNPFANTSWSPSALSNATKTVSNAQAEREKRQAERDRVKATAKIQRVWRGHRSRMDLKTSRRAEFDHLYQSTSDHHIHQRPRKAVRLLITFFKPCLDDIQRLTLFTRDVDATGLSELAGSDSQQVFTKLGQKLLEALDYIASSSEQNLDAQLLIKFTVRTMASNPAIILPVIDNYFAILSKFFQTDSVAEDWADTLTEALRAPFAALPNKATIFSAYAFSFLATPNLRVFESNTHIFSDATSSHVLANAIVEGYTSGSSTRVSKDGLLWLLAHFIDLNRSTPDTEYKFTYLEALHAQLSALASEINIRLNDKASDVVSDSEESLQESLLQPLDPYICSQLMSLVETSGISKLLHDFSANLGASSGQMYRDTSLLTGYILTLLRCFPGSGDDIRMRLFLAQMPAVSGNVTIVKYLWQITKQTSVFHKLQTESENPVDILRRYLQADGRPHGDTVEDRDWRNILLFLELYIFVLRLSDDEDFFSAIRPRLLESNSSTSRIRSCSLSLEDLKALSIFLKNTAFTLHYHTQALSTTPANLRTAMRSRVDSHSSPGAATTINSSPSHSNFSTITHLDLESLRDIITTVIKMVYERDSRDQFLPSGHWLMADWLDREDFIRAVIDEERRDEQDQQDSDGSDNDGVGSSRQGWDPETGYSLPSMNLRVSRLARIEQLRSQQKRVQKERQLAEMGPKLEILKHMPFVVPFETRVRIFRAFTNNDRARRNGHPHYAQMHIWAKHHAKIRRDHLFEDAFDAFYKLGDSFKEPIQITFVDQFGTTEAGIDGGGVTKEFLTRITSEAFGSKEGGLGMFKSSHKGLLYPDPTAVDVLRDSLARNGIGRNDPEYTAAMTQMLRRFEFLGRIVAKCMYENILVDLAFAGFFLLKWTTADDDENKYKGSINDLKDMDEELYRGMLQLKHYPGDVADLGFDFTISDQVSGPGEPVRTVTRKLIPNGDQIAVTNDNRLLYISYVARHRLAVQSAPQTAAFLRGVRTVVKPSWISMFNQSELQRLVGGDSSEIDLEDLRQNTVYSGLYEVGDDGEEHPTIKLFWKVMEGFTDEQRRDVLKYVSSTPRAPLLGFSALTPKFSIRDGGTDEERLPSTSTCVNLLKLPRYTKKKTLRQKLLYAVQSGAGFDLS